MAVGEPEVSVDQVLPRRPVAVRHARALATDALGTAERRPHDELQLVITELVANAVRHGRGRRMRLRLVTRRDGSVRVEVENRCWHTTPRRRLLNPSTTTGRGLALVEAYSRRWGVERGRGRTRVWAEVDRP